ncbi:alpha/beta hydrolase [Euzebya tangerina]|uniref:alpha/beta hydrolase n=1 Tax=Euzebya tangerina TaxID=591198 RepID=UPI000E3122DA|nr:alpha/beta hydrolase [Euzebya tangerina]
MSGEDTPALLFASSPGGRIAYQQWGAGEDVVGVPPLAQNIELAWEWPDIRAMFDRFGAMARYTHYDKRGTGASDRIRGVPTPDERVDDMRLVMDVAGIERAHLLGNSDGGMTALLFAATYPDRVATVVLFGSGATVIDPAASAVQRAASRAGAAAFTAAWGTRASVFVDRFAPSRARDSDFRRWHQRYERSCCDAATLRDLIAMSWGSDVREVCAQVDRPVLLLHRTGDRVVDVSRAREAAALLPDARVVEVAGSDHLGYIGDREVWLDEMERWITGRVAVRSGASATGRPQVRTFGGFGVSVDGRDVPLSAWGGRHARTLVKRLAAARGWPVPRSELQLLLWPGETDIRALGPRLSVQLSMARRVLGGGLTADREAVRLDLGAVDLDLQAFDQATSDTEIVAGYGGPFLPEEDDTEWAVPTRTAAAVRFAAAATRRATALLDEGLPGWAAEIARRMIEYDPYDLDGHELLVTALLRVEQPAAVAQVHQAWVAAAAERGVQVPPLDPA